MSHDGQLRSAQERKGPTTSGALVCGSNLFVPSGVLSGVLFVSQPGPYAGRVDEIRAGFCRYTGGCEGQASACEATVFFRAAFHEFALPLLIRDTICRNARIK